MFIIIQFLQLMKAIIYQTFDDIPKRFLCLYCFNFAKIPVQCGVFYCQAMYCYRCIKIMEQTNINCYKCKYETEEKQIDVITKYVTSCKLQVKASKYQKHIKYCHQNCQELQYFKHILKQIDNIQIIICAYCNKKCGFQQFLINSFSIQQLLNQTLNLCQCAISGKLLDEDRLQLFIQNTFECCYCQIQINLQDLIHHFYVCQFLQINCQAEGCQWKNTRNKFTQHFIHCINKIKLVISSTDKVVDRMLKSEQCQLNLIREKMNQIDKNIKKIMNLTFLNDRQQTESIICSPQNDRVHFDPRVDWHGLLMYLQD
ncbi:hypothetical protein pb186bvf_013476 [Paramecium bursaria]